VKIDYRKPPVSETSVGVGFAPLQGWDVHFFGEVLEAVRPRYSRFEAAPPLAIPTQGLAFRFSAVPPIRGLYFSSNNTQLVQVQDNLFFVNWRKWPPENSYPHYGALRSRFGEDWDTFCNVLTRFGVPLPIVSRYQLAYVNVVPHADVRPTDLFTRWSPPDGMQQADATINSSYRLAERNVDVAVSLQPGLRVEDNLPVSQLTIVVGRNAPHSSDPVGHFDDLHDVLIETFQAITSQSAQQRWEPKHE
jgi:uncharacterized protein (TIGR04255 family)